MAFNRKLTHIGVFYKNEPSRLEYGIRDYTIRAGTQKALSKTEELLIGQVRMPALWVGLLHANPNIAVNPLTGVAYIGSVAYDISRGPAFSIAYFPKEGLDKVSRGGKGIPPNGLPYVVEALMANDMERHGISHLCTSDTLSSIHTVAQERIYQLQRVGLAARVLFETAEWKAGMLRGAEQTTGQEMRLALEALFKR